MTGELRPGLRVMSPVGEARLLRRQWGSWVIVAAGAEHLFPEADLHPVYREERGTMKLHAGVAEESTDG